MSDARISAAYRAQLVELHSRDARWGTSAPRWASKVADLAAARRARSILDYGCGKGELANHIPGVRNYDPATFPDDPAPADLVACLDVLEHVEPESLPAVLADLARLTVRVCFAVIATRPAIAKLPDGRNAHLIVQDASWWRLRLGAHFRIKGETEKRGEFIVTLEPIAGAA